MKRMMALAVTLMALLAFPFAASAEEKALEFSTTVGYFSQYVGPFGGTYHDEVIQADFGIVHPSGFHFDVWGSYSSDGGWNSDFGDELDIIAGFTRTLGPLEVDLGAAYYDVLKIGTFDDEDIWGVTLNVSAPEVFRRFTPFVNLELDFPSSEGGLLYQAGIKRPFGWIGSGDIVFFTDIFEATLLLNGHSGVFGIDPELVSSARASLSANFSIGQFALSPEVHYQVGFGGNDGMAKDGGQFWWGVNASFTF